MKSQISVLKNSLSGDLLDGKFDNGRYSTDASIYQIMPEAVILPKNIEDIKKTIQFSQEHNIPILPRGGGTSQNGQTVNRAIVLDNSKYLNKIIEVDAESMYEMHCNLFSISPTTVISGEGFERVNAQLRDWGYRVIETPMNETSKMEGLLRCVTLPIQRS